jgi:MFS family permease
MHHRAPTSDDVTQPDSIHHTNPYEVPYIYDEGKWIPLHQGKGKKRKTNSLDEFYRPSERTTVEHKQRGRTAKRQAAPQGRTDFYHAQEYISYPEYMSKQRTHQNRLSAIDELEIHESKPQEFSKNVYSTRDLDLERMSSTRSDLSSFCSTIDSKQFGKPSPRETKLDPFGAPLEPQPLNDENDPLTWSGKRKYMALILISCMSFLSQFLAVSIAPAMWPLHYYFGIGFGETSYTIAVYIALIGIAPYVWNPLANRYGRRPLLLVSLLGTTVAAIISGLAGSFGLMIFARSLNGLFAAIPIGLGSIVVCDLFFQHERGFYVGLYMVVQATGIPFGALLGGAIVNWHWAFYLPAILAGLLAIAVWFIMPETYYNRHVEGLRRPNMSIFQQELIRKKLLTSRKLHLATFFRPLRMFQYPSIVLPSVYYACISGYSSFFFIVTSGIVFFRIYGFHTWQNGLLLGIPLMLGSWIGEFGAGGFCDWVTRRRAMSRGGKRVAEDRLYAMLPGVILAPLGLAIEGICLHHRSHWMGAGLGIAIASAGHQIITTVTYAYTAEVSCQLFSG